MFNGLNPSTAAEYKDDPTVIRMCGFGKALGYGGLLVANARCIVSAYPEILLTNDALNEQMELLNDIAIK